MLGENDGNEIGKLLGNKDGVNELNSDWHELQVIGQSILASSVLSHKDATSPSRFVP